MKLNDALFEITKDNVLKFVTPLEIFKNYLDKPIFDKAFNSPFRKENHPSFIVKSNKAYWKDFATGEYGDCFEFVKKLYKIDFNETLIQIVHDLGIEKNFNIPDRTTIIRKKQAKVVNASTSRKYVGEFKLTIKKRAWRQGDIDYWKSYGVTEIYAKWADIVPISHYFINGIPFVADIYAYAYIENKDNIISYKIYQPFSLYKKWINNNNYSVWELWKGTHVTLGNPFSKMHSISPQSVLIITSSRKDAISIICNMGINSTALQAETIIPKPQVIEALIKKYRHLYLLLDNDTKGEKNWGQLAANRLISKHPIGIRNIVIPSKYESKDFSDLYFNHGQKKAQDVLWGLL